MRAFLLFLSRRKGLRQWMETSAAARRLASRFVAGDTLADGLEVGRRINREGISLTLDHLGENVTTLAEAEASRDVCLRALGEISESHIDGNVSIKLTQFGMDISEPACRSNVEQLVRRAKELSSFVRVDMESSGYTERTLRTGRRSARAIRRRGHGDSGLSAAQREGYRNAVPPADPRAPVQGRVSGAS